MKKLNDSMMVMETLMAFCECDEEAFEIASNMLFMKPEGRSLIDVCDDFDIRR